MEYATSVAPEQTADEPVIAPGTTPEREPKTVTGIHCGSELPQELSAVTQTVPEVEATVTDIEFVPYPDAMKAPDGKLQV